MASRNPKQIRKEVNRVNREVKRAIQARILNAPDDTKHLFPAVLRQDPAQWTVIPDTKGVLVVFVTPSDIQRIEARPDLGPFPGLITRADDTPAFIDAGGRFNLFQNCVFDGGYAFRPAPDATFIIQNHSQSVHLQGGEKYQYTVALAYLVAYGPENRPKRLRETLEELIAYSIGVWRERP